MSTGVSGSNPNQLLTLPAIPLDTYSIPSIDEPIIEFANSNGILRIKYVPLKTLFATQTNGFINLSQNEYVFRYGIASLRSVKTEFSYRCKKGRICKEVALEIFFNGCTNFTGRSCNCLRVVFSRAFDVVLELVLFFCTTRDLKPIVFLLFKISFAYELNNPIVYASAGADKKK